MERKLQLDVLQMEQVTVYSNVRSQLQLSEQNLDMLTAVTSLILAVLRSPTAISPSIDLYVNQIV
jgi:hypothetical protein